MNQLKNVFRTVKRESPILYGIVIFHFLLALGCLVGWMLDERMLAGLNVWVKPMKFSISGGIYVLTCGFLITLYPFSKRKKNIVNNIISWTMALEICIVVFQAARGVRSHYNQSSAFDGILFGMMGLLIAIIVCTMVFFIIETVRLKLDTPRPVQWGILLGWLVVLYGSWVGGQMIGQMAHNVGVADGGEGLPWINWSTIAGRSSHCPFFWIAWHSNNPFIRIGTNQKMAYPQNGKKYPGYRLWPIVLFLDCLYLLPSETGYSLG